MHEVASILPFSCIVKIVSARIIRHGVCFNVGAFDLVIAFACTSEQYLEVNPRWVQDER